MHWIKGRLKGLNLLVEKVRSSFLQFHIRRSFLPYSFNCPFNFAGSILLADCTNFRPLNNREISYRGGLLPDKLLKFLLTNFFPYFSLFREPVFRSWWLLNCFPDWKSFCTVHQTIIFLPPNQHFWKINATSISLKSLILPFSVFVRIANCQKSV